MNALLRLLLPFYLLLSCNSASLDAQNAVLTVDAFDQKLKNSPGVQLVDVRTPREYAAGHLKGALNYDYNGSEFEKQIARLDKTRPVMVYCAVGGRSAGAAARLRALRFPQVYDMRGGFNAWKSSGKPPE